MFLKFRRKISNQKTEEELLTEFSSTGDLEVLGDLYSDYMHLVYGVCLKYLSNREESMDAVMQIFEKLIIEIPKQKIANFRSWLYVVTKNFCLMQLRSGKTHNDNYKEWALDPQNTMENSFDLHPVDKDEMEMDQTLADCIDRLKDEQKACIRQFYFENKCYNEIAKNLGLDEKNVKSHLQNAKRNLKLCIEEKDERKR